MKTLHIKVIDKIATYQQRDGDIVCGNNDYQIEFSFDEEWNEHTERTARFIFAGGQEDVVFTGSICPVPKLLHTDYCTVGVYVSETLSTTPVTISCRRSVLC